MHFGDALTKAALDRSPVCVGLEPRIDKLPEGIARDIAGAGLFDRGIIDAVKDVAAVVKPQLAAYERMGWEGIKLFWESCAYAKTQGLLVIADGKRADIGSTCEMYADAYLGPDSPVDALTVNPYLGSDGVLPFLDRAAKNDKGVFVLVKTSNPSSGELQDLPAGDETVYEHLAQLAESWGMHHIGPATKLSLLGAVVGATYPEELKYLRTIMPHLPFLIPGYGAQGGTAADVAYGFLPDGTGAVVNASRSILFASAKKDWREAAGKAARAMAQELSCTQDGKRS